MFTQPVNRWWNVVAGALCAAVGAGVVGVYMFGVFAKSIGAEFGWSRVSVSLGLTAFALASGVGSLTLGLAIDRFGLRKVTSIYVLLFGGSIALVPLLPARLEYFVTAFAVMGFFGSAATVLPYATAICNWFDRERGLALGLVNAGTGIGAALMPLSPTFCCRDMDGAAVTGALRWWSPLFRSWPLRFGYDFQPQNVAHVNRKATPFRCQRL